MHVRHELLRQLRLARGSTQQEIADGIEVDVRTYRKYENGEINNRAGEPVRASQYETLRNLAALFGLPGPEELIDLSQQGPQGRQSALAQGADRARSAPAAGPGPDRRSPPPESPLPFHPAFYVHREKEERKALNRLRRAGAPVVIQAPEHYGAATLLGYLLHQATEPGEAGEPESQVLRINLSRLDQGAFASFDSLLHRLGLRVLDLLGVTDAAALVGEAWGLSGSEKTKLSSLMEQHVLHSDGRVLLALEHADKLLGFPFRDDFFGLLRGWAEAGTEAPWSRLRLLVTVSTEPSLLESIDHSSFFALSAPIRLSDLDRAQLGQLAGLYGQEVPEPVLGRLMALIGGHPYLARLALSEAQEQEVPLDQLLGQLQGDLDAVGGVFTQHLHSLRRWLEQHPELFEAVRAVLGDPGYRLRFEDYCSLYSKGLLTEREPGVCRLRCKLYEDYFGMLCKKP